MSNRLLATLSIEGTLTLHKKEEEEAQQQQQQQQHNNITKNKHRHGIKMGQQDNAPATKHAKWPGSNRTSA